MYFQEEICILFLVDKLESISNLLYIGKGLGYFFLVGEYRKAFLCFFILKVDKRVFCVFILALLGNFQVLTDIEVIIAFNFLGGIVVVLSLYF